MRQQGILRAGRKGEKPGARWKSIRRRMQLGIKEEPPESFSIIFLRCNGSATSQEVGHTIKNLFDIYEKLGEGLINDLGEWNDSQQNPPSFIVGYGKRIFELPGIQGGIPQEFKMLPDFNKPSGKRRIPIWNGSGIYYSDVKDNRADSEIIFRFLSYRESYAKRIIVETWKHIYDLGARKQPIPLQISGYYTGFFRQDRRNMLDFLDGVSNLTDNEREKLVFRNKNEFKPGANGTVDDNDPTYMAYIRILIDLPKWRVLPAAIQDQIIGREKVSGCPLNQNIGAKVAGCPTSDSDDILDLKQNNIGFRSTPSYNKEPYSLSHISKVRHLNNDKNRILRQGFNFVEESSSYPFFRTGLNFVSFQNSPGHIHEILTKPNWMGGVSLGGNKIIQKDLKHIFTAEAATVVFVPPHKYREDFPGASFLGV